MRRLLFCLALIAFLIVAPRAHHHASLLADEPSVDVTVKSQITRLEEDGLYAYKGVETRRGLQCVEYAERFYMTKYPNTFPFRNSGPGAYDIWEGVAEGKNVGGWPTYRRHYVAHENGTARPQPDDMLLYDRTRGAGWGHIAIIAEVHPNAVVILEQNAGVDTRRVLPLVGMEIVDRGVKGVIRLKANEGA